MPPNAQPNRTRRDAYRIRRGHLPQRGYLETGITTERVKEDDLVVPAGHEGERGADEHRAGREDGIDAGVNHMTLNDRKATIRDPQAISSLEPLDVSAYLRTRGWNMLRSTPGKEVIWERPSAEETPFEIQLPLDRNYRDFALRMAEVLDTLSLAEDRSQLEVFRDLQTAALDLVRIRLMAKESTDGTLPIEQGVQLIEHARDLVMASACATAQPRTWYQRNRPQKAKDYLRTVRLGQTEIGSYVITVLSRVPPELKSGIVPSAAEEPFERKVMTKLAQLLGMARTAAEDSAVSGFMERFKAAVNDGMTVNLCDAIAGLAPDPNSHDGVRVEFAWSPMRPQQLPLSTFVAIPPGAVEVIAEAGKMLRTFAPLEDIELTGTVVRLEAGETPEVIAATIRGVVDGSRRLVRVRVKERDRRAVIRAFQDGLSVTCVGDVSRDGKIHAMENYGELAVVEARPKLE